MVVAGSPSGEAASGPKNGTGLWGAALLVLLASALWAIRLGGPSDLMDNDQLRPAMYATDVLVNGSWVCQRDPRGDVTSKPPLYTWMVAVASLPFGRVTLFSLYLPCMLSMLVIALAVQRVGDREFGSPAGLFGGAAVLLCSYGAKHVALARTDAVFAGLVTLAALAAWRAWGRTPAHAAAGQEAGGTVRWRWLGFWGWSALATLTKGPLGPVLAAMGLWAAVQERRQARRAGAPRSNGRARWGVHLLGAGLVLGLAGGWLLAAYLTLGQAVIDRLIGRELVGHAVRSHDGSFPGATFYEPPFYLVTRFLPWSVPACIGIWRALARPSPNDGERRFERFCMWWVLGGLGVFALASHQRPDLMLPLVPGAALLGGRELARWWAPRSVARSLVAVAAVGVAALLAVGVNVLVLKHDDTMVRYTAGVSELAHRLAAVPEPRPELVDAGATFQLQFVLGVHQRQVDADEAGRRLAESGAIVVATSDPEAVRAAASLRGASVRELGRTPASGPPVVVLLTNDAGPRW